MEGSDEPRQAMALALEALVRLEVEAAVAHLSSAVRGFTAAGDATSAAVACARLGDVMATGLGNLTAARAWFARAWRLIEHEPPSLEQGWVAVAAMGCDVDDPAALLAAAELALDRARRFGDLNLETKALADAGLAHVQAGRVEEGMALLDEAMALASGPADDVDATTKSVCSFFTACYYAADFRRAGSWGDLLRQRGVIRPEPGGPVFVSSHCDSVQATLLMELGRWSEAEATLQRALDEFERAMPIPAWHAAIALAELRIRQRRLADAEALLVGKDQSMQALLPAARLHLARDDHALALATAARGLRAVAGDRLRAVELLTIVLDAHLAAGDLDAADATCEALRERAAGLDVPTLQARALAARARLLEARGDPAGAVAAIDEALTLVEGPDLPWLQATLLLDLAGLHERAGQVADAAAAARSAASVLDRLDVVLSAPQVALLHRLVPSTAAGATAPRRQAIAVLARDGGWWTASHDGTTVRLRDTKGLRYLAELVEVPGTERHALDLVDLIEGVDGDGGIDRRALGDAGALLDEQARRAYRHRIEVLRADADEALAEGRLDDAEAAQEELDELVQQLAAAFGIGGRSRVAASAAERARLNVTRALRAALGRLTDALPAPGAALDRRVRTGTYCAYEPDPADDVRWIVQH